MCCLNDNGYILRLQQIAESMEYLLRQTLLYLWTAGEELHNTIYFRESYYFLIRNVSNKCLTHERYEVMLAIMS